MNFKVIITLWISSLLIASTLVWYSTKTYYTRPLPNPNIPITSPVQSPTITMPPDLSCALAKSELNHFYTDTPVINWTILEQSRTELNLMIDGHVYIRKFMQEATIPLVQAESSNWKIGLGIGVGTAACIGIGWAAVKLHREFR